MTLYLALGNAEPIAILSTPHNADHLFKAPGSQTAKWAAGVYQWTLRANKGEESKTVGAGHLRVYPDPSMAGDRRTHAERALAAIEAALEKSAGSATVEYEFDGIKVKKSRADLLQMRDKYRLEVKYQRGGSPVHIVPVRLA